MTDDPVHTFNFPSADDSFTPTQLENHLRYIYGREGKAFKVNISFGLFLQHRESLEFRFFHPYANSAIFERPFLVSNVRGLERLIALVRELDIFQEVALARPSTKWRLVLISNVKYTVYLTSFALG